MSKKTTTIPQEGRDIDLAVKDLLQAFNLDWETGKLPLFGVDADGEMITSGSFEIYRKDSKTALGTVGGEYQSVQNSELAKILILAIREVVPSEDILRYTGTEDRGGQVVILQVKLKPRKVGTRIINRYINVLNSHDGTIAVNFGMAHSFPDMGSFRYKNSARFRHSGTVHERVKQAVEIIKASYASETRLLAKYQLMNLIKVTNQSILKDYTRTMFQLRDTRFADLSTKRMNQIVEWKKCWEMCAKKFGENVFALFMSTIHYSNVVKSDKFKNVSVMTGKSYDMNLRCYQFIEREFNL